jgi:hypothetical protein
MDRADGLFDSNDGVRDLKEMECAATAVVSIYTYNSRVVVGR